MGELWIPRLKKRRRSRSATNEISRKTRQFLGVVVYPDEIKEGALTCIVLWLSSLAKKSITIRMIKALHSFHPMEGCFESMMDNNDGGPCFIFKVRPRSKRDFIESVHALRGHAAWTLNVNATVMMLPPADVQTLIMQVMGAARKLPSRMLH